LFVFSDLASDRECRGWTETAVFSSEMARQAEFRSGSQLDIRGENLKKRPIGDVERGPALRCTRGFGAEPGNAVTRDCLGRTNEGAVEKLSSFIV
jgi:hypothetical protein